MFILLDSFFTQSHILHILGQAMVCIHFDQPLRGDGEAACSPFVYRNLFSLPLTTGSYSLTSVANQAYPPHIEFYKLFIIFNITLNCNIEGNQKYVVVFPYLLYASSIHTFCKISDGILIFFCITFYTIIFRLLSSL